MTDKTTPTPPPAPTPAQPSGWAMTALVVFQFVREYFAVISAIAIIAGVVFATVFLYAYLNVFDWHLIWMVQYPDILTFGLIAVGIIGGSATFFGQIIEMILSQTGLPSGKPNWAVITAIALFFLSLLALDIYFQHKATEPHYQHIIYAWLSGMLFVIAIFAIARVVYLGVLADGWLVVWALIALMSGTYMFGTWLGYSVLETTGYDHDVYLQDKTISQVKIVLVMSHHAIFYKDKAVYVVPTADVKQIVSTRTR